MTGRGGEGGREKGVCVGGGRFYFALLLNGVLVLVDLFLQGSVTVSQQVHFLQ